MRKKRNLPPAPKYGEGLKNTSKRKKQKMISTKLLKISPELLNTALEERLRALSLIDDDTAIELVSIGKDTNGIVWERHTDDPIPVIIKLIKEKEVECIIHNNG